MPTSPPPGDPDAPARPFVAPTALWVAFAAVVCFLYIHIPPNPDQALYDQMGIVIAGGGLVYRDCADQNFPGAPLLHALAQGLFRDPMWAFRALDSVLMLGFTVCLARAIAVRQDRLAGRVFLYLYPVMYATSGAWFAGQRDIVSGHLAMLAGLCTLRRAARGGLVWSAGAGLLLFAAFLLKPTSLLFVPGLLAVDLATRGRTGRTAVRVVLDHAAAWAAAGAAAALTVAAAWQVGVLDDWYDVAVRFNAQVYALESPGLAPLLGYGFVIFTRYWHWYTAFALAGAYFWARSGDRSLLLLLGLGLFASLTSVVAQRKGFGYHYGGCLAVLGALTAVTLARAWRWARAPGPLRLAGAAVLAVALAGSASKLNREFGDQVRWHAGALDDAAYYEGHRVQGAVEVARFLRENTAAGESVWSYCYDPLINNLSGRHTPVRFTNVYLFSMARPPFEGAGRWLAEVRAALRDRPPRFIVLRRVQGPGPSPAGPTDYTFLHPDDVSGPAVLMREVLDRHYRLSRSFHGYDVYELRPGVPPAGAPGAVEAPPTTPLPTLTAPRAGRARPPLSVAAADGPTPGKPQHP